jgi:hypothetical protein
VTLYAGNSGNSCSSMAISTLLVSEAREREGGRERENLD